MDSKAEKQAEINFRGIIPGDAVCFSASPKALDIARKGHQKLEFFKEDMGQKNHQCRSDASRMSGSTGDSDFSKSENYGAWGTADLTPNRSSNSGFTPFAVMSWSILMGSRALNIAVRMIVMAIDTLFLPFLVIFPKVIFLNKTAFLIPISAQLFVGFIVSGYLRKTKSSFLNVINRLRILSDSWCDNGSCWYKFLNLFMMSFRPDRYSTGVKAEC